MPTDMRNACWSFGAPARHLFTYLNSRLGPRLFGYDPELYTQGIVLLETASGAMDEQAAFEKMAQGLLGALQGARTFYYAGSLCVDDLFSGVQFVMDLEMVSYIRQVVEAFSPHPDIINMDGLYEECRDVALGKDTFISSMNTATRFRNIMPPSGRIVREKLQSWLSHRKLLKDRAKEEALQRIREFEPVSLPDDQQRELDKIYARAEADLLKRPGSGRLRSRERRPAGRIRNAECG
jgi:trimethylamine:corrinoid methyltransferase-like protein